MLGILLGEGNRNIWLLFYIQRLLLSASLYVAFFRVHSSDWLLIELYMHFLICCCLKYNKRLLKSESIEANEQILVDEIQIRRAIYLMFII